MHSSELVERVAQAMDDAIMLHPLHINTAELAARAAITACLETLAESLDAKSFTRTYNGSEGPYTLTYDLRMHYASGGAGERFSDYLRAIAAEINKDDTDA